MKNKSISNKWLFVISLIIMIFIGCAGGAFRTAQEKNTVEAYNKFIQEYGDSKFAPQAKKMREDLKFSNAKKENTISGYDRYLKEYPKGTFVSEVNKLRELNMFENA
uniref:tetratricopeptide repeat protein n=1 Tax=Desulfosarcina cetonica TaxID=90730 RepID=UPI0012ED592E